MDADDLAYALLHVCVACGVPKHVIVASIVASWPELGELKS